MNPTVVMTAMGKKAWSDPSKAGTMLSRIPLGRFVGIAVNSQSPPSLYTKSLFSELDEVVQPILFLLSEQSSMINCATLSVDGGFAAC